MPKIDIEWSKYNKILTDAYGAHTNPDYFIENGGWVTERARDRFFDGAP
jgi:hypothetical protein